MAEAALFSVASKLLSTLASPAFEKAYEKACSIWNARAELDKLKSTIRTIQARLLDAERKQNDSASVKDWIMRVKDVLYDADDLFDEVATDDMLRQQIKGSKVMKKVRVSCSRLNPLVSNNSVAKKVKAIRERLQEISRDMNDFNFVECRDEKPIFDLRKGQEPGSFVDSKNVIGRDKDMEAILEMILHKPGDTQQDVQVIAIVGIGGMGKTTLTQLVYNHEEVQKNFEKMWFACISDTSDDKEVFGKIFQSIDEEYKGNFTLPTLQNKIKESIEDKKFLLVLDDVWDDHRGRWQSRISLLSSGAKGGKIIVSTRSSLVARAMGALETHNLCGLSEEDSWDLFKSVVSFTPEQEEDSTWTELGREIVKKCANVPLAVKSIASLLFEKNTLQEWESIRDEELPTLGQRHEDGIMPVLKLSYEHLPSNLKHCFAYCSLFPEDHLFKKDELIKLWFAQGYINPTNGKESVEDVGHSYLMHLFRRSFFMEYTLAPDQCYKMHDLIHELAKHVAGEESLMLIRSSKLIKETRHVSVFYGVDESRVLPEPLHSVSRLRSLLFMPPAGRYSRSELVLGNQFTNFKSLRALTLKYLGIEDIPSSIGELKHLRYLDLSWNSFKELPDSITKLVNLCTLDLYECSELETWPANFGKLINLRHLHCGGCKSLEHMPHGLGELVNLCTLKLSRCDTLAVWPDNFSKLVNLRHLHNLYCYRLKHMPAGFEELACLQQLDTFSVGKGMGRAQRSKLDVLPQLKLRGELRIKFEDETDDWDGVECWQPPLALQELSISGYKGMRMPNWGNGRALTANPSLLPKLTSLKLWNCERVKCLPPFRHIPNIKKLYLRDMEELEYIEVEETGCDVLFIPDLERLQLYEMPKLKGWWRKDDASADPEHRSASTCTTPQLLSFTSLSYLDITRCPELNSMPLCPRLQSVRLKSVTVKLLQQLLATSDTTSSSSLTFLSLRSIMELKRVDLPPFHLNNIEKLILRNCPDLELWEEKKRGVDWDSLLKLRRLKLDEASYTERLPDCLRRRQALGELRITYAQDSDWSEDSE